MATILGANTLSSAYDVANGVRFEDGDNAKMSRSISGSPTDPEKYTFSCWIKRGNLTEGVILGNYANANFRAKFGFDSNHKLEYYQVNDGSASASVVTTQVFRDTTAWYHIVLTYDSSQGTAADRVKFYVNGTVVSSYSGTSYPAQDLDSRLNQASQTLVIGQDGNDSKDFDGYMCELVLIDGQALDATSFGEFDSDTPTTWKPKDPSSLTFGDDGFYLDFEDSGDLGDDESGNGNDFTETNLAATDQTTDTCTNNFATLNSLVNFNSGVFTEGNCAITFGDDTISTIGVTRGRWYWEAQRTNTSNEAHFGIGLSRGFSSATSIVSSGDRVYVRGGATFVSATSNLSILTFGSNNGTPASVGNGDVIGFYLDLESDTKNITIKKNDGATPVIDIDLTYSGSDAEEPIFAFCRMNSGCSSSWNFGNPIAALTSANSDPNGFGSFEFSTTLSSVDYYALCSKNLAEFG